MHRQKSPGTRAFEQARGVCAAGLRPGFAHIVVSAAAGISPMAHALSVFELTARSGIPVSLSKFHAGSVSFALEVARLPEALELLSSHGLNCASRTDLALISVSAVAMREMHGVMAEIADAVHGAGATLVETGDSHDSVFCLTENELAPAVLERLSRAFSLSPEDVADNGSAP